MSFCFIGRIVLCFILFNFIVFFHALICAMCIIWQDLGNFLGGICQPVSSQCSTSTPPPPQKRRFSDMFRGYRSEILT